MYFTKTLSETRPDSCRFQKGIICVLESRYINPLVMSIQSVTRQTNRVISELSEYTEHACIINFIVGELFWTLEIIYACVTFRNLAVSSSPGRSKGRFHCVLVACRCSLQLGHIMPVLL